MQIKQISVLVWWWWWIVPVVAAQPGTYLPAQVNKEIGSLMALPELRGASLGVYVALAAGGRPLVALNENLSLAPASVMKLLTTGAALSVFGGSYQCRTTLEHSGEVDMKGTLHGDLYIRGGGDPTLGSKEPEKLMANWVLALQKAGIKQINGAVVGDGSLFGADNTPGSWMWIDLANYYGAGVSGLSYRHNQFDVIYQAGAKAGEATKILRTDPAVPGLNLINEVRTGAAESGDEAYLYGAPYTYLRYVRGTIPPSRRPFRVRAALPDAELQCATELRAALQKNGIAVGKAATTVRFMASQGQTPAAKRRQLAVHLSAPLRELVKTTNVKSFNLYAESFFRLLGQQKFGKGDQESAAKALRAFWESKGLDLAGFFIEDGSGLSRFNAATPRQLAEALRVLKTSPTFSDFYFSLPVVGKTGTVASFGKGTRAANNARLKSGYLTRVKSYAGYLNLATGETMIVVVVVNNYDGKDELMTQRLEKIVGLVAAMRLR